MKILLVILIGFVSAPSFAKNHRLCKEIEKINAIESMYNMKLSDQVVFSIEADEENAYELQFESGFLRCIYDEKKGKYSLKVRKGHAICVELERVNRNEEKYNIPTDKQVVFSMEADAENPAVIETESGDLSCVKKNNGKWKAILND